MSKADKFKDRSDTLKTVRAASAIRERLLNSDRGESLSASITPRPVGLTAAERRALAEEALPSERARNVALGAHDLIVRQHGPKISAPSELDPEKRGIVGYIRSNAGPDEIACIRRDLEAYAGEKYGRRLDAFYIDKRLPGPAIDVPSLRRLMSYGVAGSVGVVLMPNVDEISLNRRFRNTFAVFCDRLDIEVHTLEQGRLSPCLTSPCEAAGGRGRIQRTFLRHDKARRNWDGALAALMAARKPVT